jgi:hypothetical protein
VELRSFDYEHRIAAHQRNLLKARSTLDTRPPASMTKSPMCWLGSVGFPSMPVRASLLHLEISFVCVSPLFCLPLLHLSPPARMRTTLPASGTARAEAARRSSALSSEQHDRINEWGLQAGPVDLSGLDDIWGLSESPARPATATSTLHGEDGAHQNRGSSALATELGRTAWVAPELPPPGLSVSHQALLAETAAATATVRTDGSWSQRLQPDDTLYLDLLSSVTSELVAHEVHSSRFERKRGAKVL